MKHWTIAIATLWTIGILAGCAASAKKLNQLQVGMTKQEIIQVLGTPQSIELRDGIETLHYTLSEDRLAEGLFIGVMRPLKIGVGNYRVILVDNKQYLGQITKS